MADELRADDIMTEGVIAVEQDMTVQEAATMMRDEDIRSLVVLEKDEAVGIVVGRDIVYQVTSEGRDVTATTVGDIMTNNLVTAATNEEVADLARTMIRNDISRIPILRGNQVVGIVTQSNILQAWPSYIDLLQEENELYPFENTADTNGEETAEGECARCENYSDELVNVNGEFLCPACRIEL